MINSQFSNLPRVQGHFFKERHYKGTSRAWLKFPSTFCAAFHFGDVWNWCKSIIKWYRYFHKPYKIVLQAKLRSNYFVRSFQSLTSKWEDDPAPVRCRPIETFLCLLPTPLAFFYYGNNATTTALKKGSLAIKWPFKCNVEPCWAK